MEKEIIKFNVDDRIIDVAGSLRENKISGAPVVDKEGKLAGIISEGDIITHEGYPCDKPHLFIDYQYVKYG